MLLSNRKLLLVTSWCSVRVLQLCSFLQLSAAFCSFLQLSAAFCSFLHSIQNQPRTHVALYLQPAIALAREGIQPNPYLISTISGMVSDLEAVPELRGMTMPQMHQSFIQLSLLSPSRMAAASWRPVHALLLYRMEVSAHSLGLIVLVF